MGRGAARVAAESGPRVRIVKCVLCTSVSRLTDLIEEARAGPGAIEIGGTVGSE